MQQLFAFSCGILSHLLYFRRGEHHLQSTFYLYSLLTTIGISTILVHSKASPEQLQHWPTSLHTVLTPLLTYLIGLYLSLTLYRLHFHPLHHIPGPLPARLSSFYLSFLLRNSDGFKQFQALHNQYGAFVRVGPSDVSIVHATAVQALYGPDSKCTKGPYYDFSQPIVSLHTMRDRALHDERRRVWSRAFGLAGLRGYETRVKSYQDKLIQQLEARGGSPVNAKQWFSFYAFDVMGELAFGRSFDMLETGKNHWAIKMMDDGVNILAFMIPIWFLRLAMAVPGATRELWRLMGFSREMLLERMKTNPGIPDITSVLLEPLKGRQPTKQDLDVLTGDTFLIITAGSDTTATTLTSIFYLLTKHPKEVTRLRNELLQHATPSKNAISSDKIAHLPHLNGVINEAMRLYPPVPSAIYRKTPPEGITIDGTYIPGGMTVYSNQYYLGRSE
jgi:tryprostatin B 6-hydroxylase